MKKLRILVISIFVIIGGAEVILRFWPMNYQRHITNDRGVVIIRLEGVHGRLFPHPQIIVDTGTIDLVPKVRNENLNLLDAVPKNLISLIQCKGIKVTPSLFGLLKGGIEQGQVVIDRIIYTHPDFANVDFYDLIFASKGNHEKNKADFGQNSTTSTVSSSIGIGAAVASSTMEDFETFNQDDGLDQDSIRYQNQWHNLCQNAKMLYHLKIKELQIDNRHFHNVELLINRLDEKGGIMRPTLNFTLTGGMEHYTWKVNTDLRPKIIDSKAIGRKMGFDLTADLQMLLNDQPFAATTLTGTYHKDQGVLNLKVTKLPPFLETLGIAPTAKTPLMLLLSATPKKLVLKPTYFQINLLSPLGLCNLSVDGQIDLEILSRSFLTIECNQAKGATVFNLNLQSPHDHEYTLDLHSVKNPIIDGPITLRGVIHVKPEAPQMINLEKIEVFRDALPWLHLDGMVDATKKEKQSFKGTAIVASLNNPTDQIHAKVVLLRDGTGKKGYHHPDKKNNRDDCLNLTLNTTLKSRWFDGPIELFGSFNAIGPTLDDYCISLKGHGRFTWINPRIKGVSLEKALAVVEHFNLDGLDQIMNENSATRFDKITGSFSQVSGSTITHDTVAKFPQGQVCFDGEINWLHQSIKGTATVELKSLKIPLVLGLDGRLSKPKIRVDSKTLGSFLSLHQNKIADVVVGGLRGLLR